MSYKALVLTLTSTRHSYLFRCFVIFFVVCRIEESLKYETIPKVNSHGNCRHRTAILLKVAKQKRILQLKPAKFGSLAKDT